MNTKAIPVLPGSACNSSVNASKPPADAPTATIAECWSLLGVLLALRRMSRDSSRVNEDGRVRGVLPSRGVITA
jgi:hypothetical protein